MNFYFKNHFHELSLGTKILDKKIAQEQQNLSNLNAEFSYLTSPKHLQKPSKQYLNLQQVHSSQIIKELNLNLINKSNQIDTLSK